MSTYWGYRCTSHDPPLDSETWYNHGEHTLQRGLLSQAAWREIDGEALDSKAQHVLWLRDHPKCKVEIVNEYGETLVGGAPSRSDSLTAASIISAYRQMILCSTERKRAYVVRELRRAIDDSAVGGDTDGG